VFFYREGKKGGEDGSGCVRKKKGKRKEDDWFRNVQLKWLVLRCEGKRWAVAAGGKEKGRDMKCIEDRNAVSRRGKRGGSV